MSDNMDKVARLGSILRKAIKPTAYTTAAIGTVGGGYAAGKGVGKEEQLTADQSSLRRYLEADYKRDVRNINKAQEEAFLMGFQYAHKKPKKSGVEKKAAMNPELKAAIKAREDLTDRIADIEDASYEGVNVDPSQYVRAQRMLDVLQTQYGSDFEKVYGRSGAAAGGALGATAGIAASMAAGAQSLKTPALGALGGLVLGALAGRSAGRYIQREDTRAARRRQESRDVRKYHEEKIKRDLERLRRRGVRQHEWLTGSTSAPQTVVNMRD